MCIATVCCPGCDVIKFEINLVVLIKPLCYMAKKSRQKLKYLENEKSVKYKVFFIIFRGLSSAKKFLRLENAPLKLQLIICHINVALTKISVKSTTVEFMKIKPITVGVIYRFPFMDLLHLISIA